MNALAKYNKVQVVLHWSIAIIVLLLLISAEFLLDDVAANDPAKIGNLRLHMIFGISALILSLIRIIWAWRTPQPAHVVSGISWMDRIAPFRS